MANPDCIMNTRVPYIITKSREVSDADSTVYHVVEVKRETGTANDAHQKIAASSAVGHKRAFEEVPVKKRKFRRHEIFVTGKILMGRHATLANSKRIT